MKQIASRFLFIGGGNMAQALIGGLLAQGIDRKNICVADPSISIQSYFQQQNITTVDALSAITQVDVVVVAVKPQILADVLRPLAHQLSHQLVISVVAGAEVHSIAQLLGGYSCIVRVMPNTPALLQQGASGMYAHESVSNTYRELAEQIMAATGLAVWVQQEKLIDAVTAVSGSGPAYFFYVMQAMIEAGQKLGLDKDTASQLTLQTALGAAQMAQQSQESVEELRRRVTSPHGTTQAAIESLQQHEVATHIEQAMQAAYVRSGELATTLSQHLH